SRAALRRRVRPRRLRHLPLVLPAPSLPGRAVRGPRRELRGLALPHGDGPRRRRPRRVVRRLSVDVPARVPRRVARDRALAVARGATRERRRHVGSGTCGGGLAMTPLLAVLLALPLPAADACADVFDRTARCAPVDAEALA